MLRVFLSVLLSSMMMTCMRMAGAFTIPTISSSSSSSQRSASTTRLYQEEQQQEQQQPRVLEGRKIVGDLKPVNDFLLVKTVGTRAKVDSLDGFQLTGQEKIVKTEGKVLAIGEGTTHPESGLRQTIQVEPGEGVVYGEYDGIEISLDGQTHMLIREENVLLKFVTTFDEDDVMEPIQLANVNVIHDNVLIRVDASAGQTTGGVLLAASSSSEIKRPSTGTVIKVGPGKMASNGNLLPMAVSEGDTVKFREYGGNEVLIEGQEYTVVSMANIVAKF